MLQSIMNNQAHSQTKGDRLIDELTRRDREKSTFKSEFEKKIGKESADLNSKPKDKKLWDTCVEFESIFVTQMFNAMRKTVEKGELLHGGHAEEIFEDFLYDEYAQMTSKNSNLGIASMLYKQLS